MRSRPIHPGSPATARRSSHYRPLLETLEMRRMLSVTGAIWTTNADCTVVNGNIYDSAGSNIQANKMTVYLNGGPRKIGAAGLNPNSDYWVRVTDPSGKSVLGSSVYLNKTLHSDANGELPCVRLWDVVANYGKIGKTTGQVQQGYLDTPNPGGEYKVWVSLVNTFAHNESKTDNFKVRPPRGMHGHKFHDHNGNGQQDSEDENLDGVTVFLDGSNGKAKNGALDWTDANVNGIWDAGEGEQWTVTSTMGEWSLVPAAGGTFSPREISPAGWLQASQNPNDVVLGSTEKKPGGNFGNFKKINVCGVKYDDRNNNGVRDGGEESLNGFTIQLFDKDGTLVGSQVTADIDLNGNAQIDDNEHGVFCFANVGPGQFTIKEQTPTGGWVITEGAAGYTFNTRSGEDQTTFVFGNHISVDGRMTGGGSTFTNDAVRVTHGFQVHTDLSRHSNLQVNWAKQRFHLTALTSADGQDNLNIDQGRPTAPIDTFIGKGYGLYNGKIPAVIVFTFVDAGEGGASDIAKYLIALDNNGNHTYDSSDSVVLNQGPKSLTFGNHQAHQEIGSQSSAAAQVQQQIDVDLAQLDNDNLSDAQVLSLNTDLLKHLNDYEAALLA